MAKDILDNSTIDGIEQVDEMDFHELQHGKYSDIALRSGGHYQAVKPCQYYKVTGNRYAGSNTPDVVRDLWATPRDVVAYMEADTVNMILTLRRAKIIKSVKNSTARKQTA